MATPIAHGLFGLGMGTLQRRSSAVRRAGSWYLFAIFAANAPDLDFLPGLLAGDINRFHQGPTHSLLAAIAFGLLACIAAWRRSDRRRLGAAAGAIYGSHLLLDFFTRDLRVPYGQPLLWPFSDQHFLSPWTPLGGVLHADPGDPLSLFLSQVFSWHNARVALLEILIFGPWALLAWWSSRSSRPWRSSDGRSTSGSRP